MTPGQRAALAWLASLPERRQRLQRRQGARVRARLARLALGLGLVELVAVAAGLGGAL